MARPIKDGVLYFPKDCDFYHDMKVRTLRGKFGAKGMYLLDYLLCEIYSKNGYYLQWDDNSCFLVSDDAGCGCSPGFVDGFVTQCVLCEFFDKRVFDLFGVLTSAGIQRRYARMCEKRKKFYINEEYLLLNVNDERDLSPSILSKLVLKNISTPENPLKGEINKVSSPGNAGKKRERKDTDVSKNKKVSVPEEIRSSFQAYCEMRKSLKKPLTETGIRLALKNLEELAPGDYEKQNRILDQSVFRSWQGLFPLKTAVPPKETSPGRQKKKTKIDKEAVEQLEEAILYGMGEDHP